MKRIVTLLMSAVLLFSICTLLVGCDTEEIVNTLNSVSQELEDSNTPKETATKETVSKETVAKEEKTNANLGDYNVEILGCRLATDYAGNDIIIVKYNFTNVKNEDPANFSFSIEDNVYQDGVGLNECYFADDSANYNSDNALKEIKKGASIEVEVAYELNDSTTDLEVEVKEFFSLFDDTIITKTFSLQ